MLFNAIAWSIWGVVALVAVIQGSIARTSQDGGVRILAGRCSLLFVVGLALTLVPTVSKLHLLWFAPLAYLGNMFLTVKVMEANLQRGLGEHVASASLPEIIRMTGPNAIVGPSIPWGHLIGRVFEILEFDPHRTTFDSQGTAQAPSVSEPYGFLQVTAPDLANSFRLPIVHRDDFTLAAWAYEDGLPSSLGDDAEFLVTYAPQKVRKDGRSADDRHVFHYVVCPAGTLSRLYETPEYGRTQVESLFGPFVYYGEIQVQVNRNPSV